MDEPKSAFQAWNPIWDENGQIYLRPEVLSIIVVTIILAGLIIYYYFYMKKLDPKKPPKGMAFFIFNLINFFKNLIIDVVGPSFVKFTPYIITLFLYITGCNLISLIGLENPTASTTVTFSMGFISVLGMVVTAIRYQKSRFFLKFLFKFNYTSKKTGKTYLIPYCINPFGLLDIVTPLISISLRLWGNIFAGALILSLLYAIPMAIVGKNPTPEAGVVQGPELLIASVFAVPIHGFLDVMIGTIQAYVFVILTLCYCGNEASEEEPEKKVIEHGVVNNLENSQIQVQLKSMSNID